MLPLTWIRESICPQTTHLWTRTPVRQRLRRLLLLMLQPTFRHARCAGCLLSDTSVDSLASQAVCCYTHAARGVATYMYFCSPTNFSSEVECSCSSSFTASANSGISRVNSLFTRPKLWKHASCVYRRLLYRTNFAPKECSPKYRGNQLKRCSLCSKLHEDTGDVDWKYWSLSVWVTGWLSANGFSLVQKSVEC